MSPTLSQDCPEPGHDRHYTMPGRCWNCGAQYVLSIPVGHRAPRTTGWKCENCWCNDVHAITPLGGHR